MWAIIAVYMRIGLYELSVCVFCLNFICMYPNMDCCREYRDHHAIYPHTHCFNMPQIAFYTVLGILYLFDSSEARNGERIRTRASAWAHRAP